MATSKKKVQSDNQSLANLTGAKYVHIDGSNTGVIPIIAAGDGGRLLRVILNTNGATLTLKAASGGEVIGIIATDAPEQTFNYGVFCPNGLIAQASGALDATVVYG